MEPALNRQQRLMAPVEKKAPKCLYVLTVGLGGFAGAVPQFSIDRAISPHSSFPWSTFVGNIIECFLIGWFSELFR